MMKSFKLMCCLGCGLMLGGCVVMRCQENPEIVIPAPAVAIQPTVVVQEPNYIQPVYVQPNYIQPVYVQPVYVPPPVVFPCWRPCPPPCPPPRPMPMPRPCPRPYPRPFLGPHPYPQRGR